MQGEENFDFVVVGAGSSGCVLANRLSEDGKSRVALVEAGPKDTNPWIHVPIGYGKTMWNDRLNWRFHTEPEPTMGDRRIYWPRGRVLGGCSSINGLIVIRGQQEDYDGWAARGATGWGLRMCSPTSASWRTTRISPAIRCTAPMAPCASAPSRASTS